MYIPPAFREEDLAVLQALMRDNSFAIVVTMQGGVPVATHLPLLLDSERGPYGTLLGHVSRANASGPALTASRRRWRSFRGRMRISRPPGMSRG